jgi:hypothetical protein
MKGLKRLAVIALGAALLAVAAPVSARGAAFKHYVACGLSKNAKPAHACQKSREKGAFFQSNDADVFYTVCVKFPNTKSLCKPRQQAIRGTLYVNKITSNIPGKHRVTWFVGGERVGAFSFLVTG